MINNNHPRKRYKKKNNCENGRKLEKIDFSVQRAVGETNLMLDH